MIALLLKTAVVFFADSFCHQDNHNYYMEYIMSILYMVTSRQFITTCLAVLAVCATVFASTGHPTVSVEPIEQGSQAGYDIHIEIPGIERSTKMIEGEPFEEITLPGWQNTHEPGKPSLPGKTLTFEIPPNSKPVITVKKQSVAMLEQVDIAPSQPYNQSGIPAYDRDIYDSSAPYPTNSLTFSGTTWARNHKLLIMGVAPIQYRPAARTLSYATSMDISIRFEDDPDAALPLDGDLEALASPIYDGAAGAGIHGFNYFDVPDDYVPKYMIICFDEFATNAVLQEFIVWKEKKGLDVTVLKASDVPDMVDAWGAGYDWVNSELYYDLTWDGFSGQLGYLYSMPAENYPDYMLFIGDASQTNGIPASIPNWGIAGWYRTYYDARLANFPPTRNDQLFYVIPDCFYGRIPATNNAELSIMLGNAMEMDRTPPTEGDSFYQNATIAGMCDLYTSTDQMMYRSLEAVDGLANYLEWTTNADYSVERIWAWPERGYTPTNTTKWSRYTHLWRGATGTTATIGTRISTQLLTDAEAAGKFAAQLNAGSAISVHYGAPIEGANYDDTSASGVRALETPHFTVDEAKALTNGNKRTLLLALSGDAGGYNFTNTLIRAMLNNTNGGAYAAIAGVYGGSSATWWNNFTLHGMFQGLFRDYRPYYYVSTSPVYMDGPFRPVEDRREGSATRLGEMLHYAKMRAHEIAPGYWDFADVMQGMQLYGDPEAAVMAKTPATLNVVHSPRAYAGLQTIEISGLGENAAVCLYSEEDGIKELKRSHNDKVYFYPTLSGTGTLYVTATKFGYRPYEGVIHFGNPYLSIELPATANEGDGTLAGQGILNVEEAPDANLLVELTSSDVTELRVPEFVWIPAGETNIAFDLTIENDGFLDGNRTVDVIPSAPDYESAPGTMIIQDALTCDITMILDSSATEGQGSITGMVNLSVMPMVNIDIALSCSDTSELVVPPSVSIISGSTNSSFTVQIIDDDLLDRTTTTTVQTVVGNWGNTTSTVEVLDNESLAFGLTIPADVWENAGILTNAGTVSISGYYHTDLTVNLSVEDVAEITTPTSVVIPTGQTSAYFNITVGSDGLFTGTQTARITAAAATFTSTSQNCSFHDGDVFDYEIILSTNLWNAGHTHYLTTIKARNVSAETILTFTETVNFAAVTTNANSITPTNSESFVLGVWTGLVGAAHAEHNMKMRVYDANSRAGTSTSINVVSPFISWDLDTQPAGWTLDANWEYGMPQGPTHCSNWYGTAGCPDEDPTAGYTGTKVFGYDLTDDRMYENNMTPKYLKTSALDFTGREDIRICFYQKLLINSFDADASLDRAAIEVSTNGTTWSIVWENGRSCDWDQFGQWLCQNNAYNLYWTYKEYTLPAWVNGKDNVYIRWVMGPTDYADESAGWNLDDIGFFSNLAGQQPNSLNQLDGVTDPEPEGSSSGREILNTAGDPNAPPPSLMDAGTSPLWISPTGLTFAIQQKADTNYSITVGNSNASESISFFVKGRETSRSATINSLTPDIQSAVQVISDGLTDTSSSSGNGLFSKSPSAGMIVIEYTFPEPVITRGAEYDEVIMPGLEAYRRIGQPVLPLRAGTVLLPQGKEIASINVVPVETRTVDGVYRLKPASQPYPLSQMPQTAEIPEEDASTYSLDTPWPGMLYQYVTTQAKRGYQLASINLLPMQYTPAGGQLQWHPKMRLEVILTDSPTAALSLHRTSSGTKRDLLAEVDNPSVLDSYQENESTVNSVLSSLAPGSYRYVIISTTNLIATPEPWNLQALRDNKIARGVSATIISTEWIYANYTGTRPDGGTDDQTKIREFIQDAYATWGTEYVLLAAGHPTLPARHFWVLPFDGGDDDEMPVDLYYACLDADCSFDDNANGIYGEPWDGPDGGENDLRSEVSVGRAPAQDQGDIAQWVRKTLKYAAESDPYLANTHFMGEHLGFGGVSEYAEGMMEQIKAGGTYDGYFTFGFTNHVRGDVTPMNHYDLYDNSSYEYTKQDVVDMINADNRHILNHLGHCNQYYWSRITTTDGLPDLTNSHPFFIYTQGCMPGWFDNDDDIEDCFAEEITTMSNGAFAVIMNARYGWGSRDSTDGPSQRFHRRFWDAVLRTNDIYMSLGRANHDSREKNIYGLTAGPDGSEDPCIRWCMYELNLFGDPEQEFKIIDSCPWMVLPTNEFTLAAGATTNLDVVLTAEELEPGEYNGLVMAQPANAGVMPASSYVELTVLPDKLQVSPADDFVLGGPYGGAFNITNIMYTITNSGPEVVWTSIWNSADNWFTAVPAGGTIASGATVDVSFQLTTNAYLLKPGAYETTFGISNTASRVTASRLAKIVVEDPLSISPVLTQTSTGMEGGPFAPTSFVYSVTNSGLAALDLDLESDQPWLSVSPSAIILGGNASVSFTAVVTAASATLSATNETIHTAWISVSNEQTAIVTPRELDLTVVEIPYLAFPLDTNPGWMLAGQWEFGKPQGLGGCDEAPDCEEDPWWGASCGYADPDSGYTGTNVFGINLNGNYATDERGASHLIAGPINLSSNARTRVAFRRQLNQDIMPYVHCAFAISRDGLNWQDIWTNATDAVTDEGWTDCMYDIGEFSDHSTNLYLRWTHQTRYPQWSQAYSGWNIDDIRIFGDEATATNGLPWPWRARDAGQVSVIGDASWNDGTFTVRGAGTDINGSTATDGFHYVYIPWDTTNGWISARVTSVENVNPWTKAGLMIRQDLDDDVSANVMMLLTPSNGARLQWRTASGNGGGDTAGPSVSAPYYLKLERTGSRIWGYVSTDGTNWTSVGSKDTTMSNNTVYVGMAVTSHSADNLAAAAFDHVQLSEGITEPPEAPVIFPAEASFSNEISVTITPAILGSDVRYTTDGTAPDAFSALYTNTLTITNTTTLKARAFIPGYAPGEIATAVFTKRSGDSTPPTVPDNFAALSTGDTSIAFGWTASTDNYDLAGYKIYINGAEARDVDEFTTNWTARGLSRDSVYTNIIRAYDWVGNLSGSSVSLVITTLAGTVDAPIVQPGSGFYKNQVFVEMWDTTTGAEIFYTINGGDPTSGSIQYTNWPVYINADSTLRVGAFRTGWNDSPVATNIYTIDTSAPTAPENLHVRLSSDSAFELAWDAATDDKGVASYRIFRDGTSVGETTNLWYEDLGLLPTTTYAYAVAAVDFVEQIGPTSSVLNVTTDPSDFGPDMAKGMAMWIKADAGIIMTNDYNRYGTWKTNGVIRWLDQSGNSNDVVDAYPNYGGYFYDRWIPNAINGKPAVRIEGSWMMFPDTLQLGGLTGMTIMVVARDMDNYGWRSGLGDAHTASLIYWPNMHTMLTLRSNEVAYGFHSPDTSPTHYGRAVVYTNIHDRFQLVTARKSGTTHELFLNSTRVHQAGVSNEELSDNSRAHGEYEYWIGRGFGSFTADNTGWKGDIAELIVFTNGISESERAVLENYLESKYRLSGRPTAPAPMIYPDQGRFTNTTVDVTFTSRVGGIFYYTTDGSTPGTNTLLYTNSPIVLSVDTTIRVVNVAAGYEPSEEASQIFWYQSDDAVMPEFDPVGGTFVGAVTVTLSSASTETDIHYTLDGSDPTPSSLLYSSPIVVDTNATILARAFKAESTSDVATAVYFINPATGGSGLPYPWQQADVGAVTVSGTATYQNAEFTNVGAGKIDSTGTADSFRYIYQPILGDCEIIAHVTAIHGDNGAARAGVMIRETLSAGSKHGFAATENGTTRNSAWRRRITTGGNNTHTSGSVGDQDRWLRIVRSGDTVTAYEKETAGGAWMTLGSPETITMTNEVLVGIAFMSNDQNILATGIFENVSVIGMSPGVTAPVMSPQGGVFSGAATVTLSCATAGADIRYTTTGAYPTTSDTLYGSPIVLTENTTLKARAFMNTLNPSDVTEGYFSFEDMPQTNHWWLEAESGIISNDWLAIGGDATASGNEYVSTEQNVGQNYTTAGDPAAGRCTLAFNAWETTTYHIWARVKAPSGSDDSLFVKFDSDPYAMWDLNEGSAQWVWQKWTSKSLTAGPHSLIFCQREDGFAIDKVCLTTDAGYTPTGLGGTSQTNPDSDGDGLPDTWENAHYGNLTTASGSTDTDGDGMTAREEYIAGTMPTNAQSVLSILSCNPLHSNGTLVNWDAVTGRMYRLYWATNLYQPDWQAMPEISGSSFTDTAVRTERVIYYHIDVRKEE